MTRTSKSRNKREIAKTIRHPKSSIEARRLIEMAMKKYSNERDAAAYLGLPNHGQLHKMRIGAIKDTQAMHAQIKLREARGRRAYRKSFYSMSNDPKPIEWIDTGATLEAMRRDAEMIICKIDVIRKSVKEP